MADIPNCPRGREEEYLSDIAGLTDNAPNNPWSRKEAYLAAIDGKMDNIEEQIAALATDISFKGSVPTQADLPENAAVGDAYITEDTGVMYVWTGTDWVALGGTGINVVQTAGDSQTDVMSQNATTSMVFVDPTTRTKVRIGSTKNISNNSIAIGNNSGTTNGSNSVAIGIGAGSTNYSGTDRILIGNNADASGNGSIGIGLYTNAAGRGCIAIGAYSSTVPNNVPGIVSFLISSSSHTDYGYNNTRYRLLKGLYDPQSSHDAATKGYVDGITESATIATTDWTALASSAPYDYSATVTLTATIGADSTVELINDQAVLFGTHGFAIGSVSGQNVTIYSIGQPDASVTLKINVKG